MKQITKKDLLKNIEEKNKIIWELENTINEKIMEIKELEEHKRNGETFRMECNLRAKFIQGILSIISGSAKPLSKYEVIRDMFSPQLKEIEESKKHNVFNHQITSLSDEINESRRF